MAPPVWSLTYGLLRGATEMLNNDYYGLTCSIIVCNKRCVKCKFARRLQDSRDAISRALVKARSGYQ